MSKEKINFYIVTASALFLGVMADLLLFGKEPGISFFIFIAMMVALSLIITRKYEKKITKTQMLFLAFSLILSVEVFLRSNPFLTFFSVIGSLYLLLLTGILSEEENFFNSRIIRFISAPIIFIINSFKSSASFISRPECLLENQEKIGSNEFRSVIKGVIMALPLLLVLGWFLYSADMIVQAYVNKLFDVFYIKINFQSAARILIVFVISYILIGVFGKITAKKTIETLEEKINPKKSTGFIESMTVMSLVETLFLAFISIQFFYLFGGKNYVWGLDTYVTYSEYAKNGFSELIFVAVISFLLIYTIDKTSKIETSKEKKTFKFLSAALFTEISIILFSALRRLLLYVDGYGLTLSRFLAFAVLFWIFSIFLLILYKIFLEKKNSVFIFMAFSLTVAVWIGINILNPDAFIARANIERTAEGKNIDPFYFTSLSDDAVPEIVKIFKLNINNETKENIASRLNWQYAILNETCGTMPYGSGPYFTNFGISQCQPIMFSENIKNQKNKTPWQSFKISKANAIQTLRDNASEIDKYLISYWKRSAEECKKNAIQCEASCIRATWQTNDDCKITCGLDQCEEFKENIKQYE